VGELVSDRPVGAVGMANSCDDFDLEDTDDSGK